VFAELQDVLDPAGLPVATRIAQLVLAGAVITHLTVLRPAGARADLMMVADMVRADLAADIRTGRLPGLDPQVAGLAQALATAERLSRKAVSREPRWPAGRAPSTLEALPQARLDGYLHQLDQAGTAYHRAVWPWWSLAPSIAPRHSHERPPARADQLIPDQPPERNVLFDRPPARPPLEAPVTSSMPAAHQPVQPEPAEPIDAGPATKRITLAISRARGVGPADTGQMVDLGMEPVGFKGAGAY
jgi:hypothetical protein